MGSGKLRETLGWWLLPFCLLCPGVFSTAPLLKAKALLLVPPAGRALQGLCKLSLQLPGSREYLQVSQQMQGNPLLHQLHKSCRIFLVSFAIGVENSFNLI